MVYPLVLGSGKRLFRDGGPSMRFRVVDSKPTSTGGLILRYRPLAASEAAPVEPDRVGPASRTGDG